MPARSRGGVSASLEHSRTHRPCCTISLCMSAPSVHWNSWSASRELETVSSRDRSSCPVTPYDVACGCVPLANSTSSRDFHVRTIANERKHKSRYTCTVERGRQRSIVDAGNRRDRTSTFAYLNYRILQRVPSRIQMTSTISHVPRFSHG